MTEKVNSIHQLIEAQAKDNPFHIALSFNGIIISYDELNKKANKLAHYLREQGVTPETLVGIRVERSPHVVISILAILKSGGAYLPIDPSFPNERINLILSDSNAKLILTEEKLPAILTPSTTKTIYLDHLEGVLKNYSNENPLNLTVPDHLAYVLYTSGTTAAPKGVMICHDNLIHAYSGWKTIYDLKNTDCHLQMTNFFFDVFSGDLIRSLCSGGKLILCPKNILLNPRKLYEFIILEKVNCAEFVPTVLRRLLSYIEIHNLPFHSMRLLICGSDNWSVAEYKKFKSICGEKTRLINSYGLTEATIDSSFFENLSNFENIHLNDSVPIGKAFPGTKIYVLDNQLNLTKEKEPGEIYIGGKGLSRGYLNQPELTMQKFIYHSVDGNMKERLFKTGDMGYYLSNGDIGFLGRKDNQVKIRGIRVELSAIENTLNLHDEIKECMVILEKHEEHQQLIAYIVTDGNKLLLHSDLRNFLSNKLPGYMIPSLFTHIDQLPLTSNGKIDRNAIKNRELSTIQS